MSLNVRLLKSAGELLACRNEWDDLWNRSDVAAPWARADLVALWVEHFAPRARFSAVVIDHDGRWVGAVPLVTRQLGGLLRVGSLPFNHWARAGDLLLDPEADRSEVLDRLVQAVSHLPWPLLWLSYVEFEEPRWRAFIEAAKRSALSVTSREHYRIGQAEIGGSWDEYLASRKGDHRRKQFRFTRRLERAGGATFEVHDHVRSEDIEGLLTRGFAVEDRGWKGVEGSSILRNPHIWEYYRQEARLLARSGELQCATLVHNNEPIAFSYGLTAKGVHFMRKIGFDEAYAQFAPGHQLIMRMLERMHLQQTHRLLDFLGPVLHYHQHWLTKSYPVGPVVVSTQRPLSRGLFHVYEHWQPRMRQLQRHVQASVDAARARAAALAKEVVGSLQSPAGPANAGTVAEPEV